MNLLTLDFETYFDSEFTLSKMTTEAYIRDPRFESLCVGIRWNEYPDAQIQGLRWYGDDLQNYLHQIDWSQTACLCHHAHFDGLILSHHYGIKPAFWLDTLSMARLVVGNHLSASLGSLAKHFNLPEKNVPYDMFKGRHWDELSPDEQNYLGETCCHDVDLTWQIFQILLPHVPRKELEIIDLTVRMFTEPVIEGDVALLEDIGRREVARKEAALAELGVTAKELGSAQQFAAILTGIGVEVEMKETPAGNIIPAVAKTDEFMKGLLEDENDIISGLAAARLDVRSTIDETRSGRLAGASRRGKLPVYLGYCAAHTTRWGGGDKVNFQNFRRGGEIRKALMAPDGHLLLVVDSSQIECRILNYLARQDDVIERFRRKEDPYVGIASKFYGREITKADKAERGTGKQLELSCGYGAGADSIVATAKRGTYGPPVQLTDAEGLNARNLYRNTHPRVVDLWGEGDQVLAFMGGPVKGDTDWRVVKVHANGDGSGWIEGPNQTRMLYVLEWDAIKEQWKRKTRRGWSKIWGGHLVENLIQYLARIDISDIMVEVKNSLFDLKLAWMSHDELVYVVPEGAAEERLAQVMALFRREPDWLPGIPLDCEGSLSKRYEK